MADLYNEKVMYHFMNPRNVGTIENADGVGQVGNPTCGDIMKMYIKVSSKQQAASSKEMVANSDKKNKFEAGSLKHEAMEEYISDIKFQTFGCGAAVATSSILTEMVCGKTLSEAEKITNQQVAKELGGLPPIKMHCSNLAASALAEAIKDYKNKR